MCVTIHGLPWYDTPLQLDVLDDMPLQHDHKPLASHKPSEETSLHSSDSAELESSPCIRWICNIAVNVTVFMQIVMCHTFAWIYKCTSGLIGSNVEVLRI